MYDYKPTLVSQLKSATGLEVYAEDFLTKSTALPCVSYFLSSDTTRKNGDTLGYSDIYYYVEVWSKKASELASYSSLIDSKMRTLGFTRVGATEVWHDGIGQIQLRYKGMYLEKFN